MSNYIRTINIVISVSVSTEKGEIGRDLVYKKAGRVCRLVVEIKIKIKIKKLE
jgi:hypothetical protein